MADQKNFCWWNAQSYLSWTKDAIDFWTLTKM